MQAILYFIMCVCLLSVCVCVECLCMYMCVCMCMCVWVCVPLNKFLKLINEVLNVRYAMILYTAKTNIRQIV